MAVVEVALLGGFDIRVAGNDVPDLPGQKERALLALLAARPDATHSRERLSSLLWSDRGDSQARDSLKHALAKLRHCLKPADTMPIVSDRQSVRLDLSSISRQLIALQGIVCTGNSQNVPLKTAGYLPSRLRRSIRLRPITLEWRTRQLHGWKAYWVVEMGAQ